MGLYLVKQNTYDFFLNVKTLLLAGNILLAMFQWSILFAITRFIGIDSAGEYSIGTMITAPVFLFLNLQLRVKLATDNDSIIDEYIYVKLRLILSIVAISVCFLLSFLLDFDDVRNPILLIFLMSIIKLFDGFFDINYGFFQKNGDFKKYAISMIYRSIIGMVFVITSICITNKIEVIIFFVILSQIFSYIIYDNRFFLIFYKGMFKHKSDLSIYMLLIKTTLPLGVASILDTLLINSQKYILINEFSISDLGVYTVLFQYIIIFQIIITTTGQYFIPKMSKYYKVKNGEYEKTLFKCIIISILVGICGLVISHFFGRYIIFSFFGFYNDNYLNLLKYFSLTGMFLYISSAIGYFLISMGKFNYNLISIAISLLVTLVLTVVLISSYGLLGGVLSLSCGYIVRIILMSAFFSYEYKKI
ncbi:polysaccharide biosynthesis C-terminal domain-containing protein [Photobacterium phosphoreum]|uniref:polysaccharide biosynthesis C-terminal domain-containing protein n=1 Tax=Photobacterium phosphoreum TaxID=659 RepID=UPI0015E71DEC|nr:polysaccharide biosynthesis C-terminal domain-containing protein [Photobacterium phosphoreum]